ncbi:MAG: lipopolysaccharide biosynthesis protein [Alphaproteobacteria bacterium]
MTAAGTADLTVATQSTVGKRIAANTGLMLGAKAVAAFLGFITLIIANHALDSLAIFGIVLFVHAYMLFFLEVATFQSWQSLIRFGTDDIKNCDVPSFSKLVKFGVLIDLISAVAAFVTALGLFQFAMWMMTLWPALGPKPGSGVAPGTLQLYVSLYCVIVLFGQQGASIGIFRLFDKFRVLAVKSLVMPVCRLFGAVIAWKSGWGIEGFLLVWFIASLAGYLFLPVAALLELRRRHLIGPILKAKLKFRRPREGLWAFVWKSNIDSTLAASFLHLPVLLVMMVFGPAFVAVFKVADEIAKLLSEGVKLLDQVIYPELARLVSSGDSSKILRIVTRAGLMTLALGLALSAIVALAGPHFLNATMGAGYSESVVLTILLVLSAAILGAAAPLYPVFYAANKPERAIYARALGLTVYIAAFFGFSAVVGQTAPGWAAIAGNFVAVVVVALWIKRTLSSAVKKEEIAARLSETVQSRCAEEE